MKNLVPKLCALVVALSTLAAPSSVDAQQPKLDIKALVGFSINMNDTLRDPDPPEEEGRERYPGWLRSQIHN